jgi:hypothetical protein
MTEKWMEEQHNALLEGLKKSDEFLEKHKESKGIRLNDHFSATVRLDISCPQPQYNLVQFNALRGASQQLISCDVDRDEFIAAIEEILDVKVIPNDRIRKD